MTVNTWINDELVTLNIEETWRTVFAHWDCLVPTDTAADIANAVCAELQKIAE